MLTVTVDHDGFAGCLRITLRSADSRAEGAAVQSLKNHVPPHMRSWDPAARGDS